MSIIRKNPAAAGLSDPSLVRKAEATLAQDVLLAFVRKQKRNSNKK